MLELVRYQERSLPKASGAEGTYITIREILNLEKNYSLMLYQRVMGDFYISFPKVNLFYLFYNRIYSLIFVKVL